MSCMRTWSSLHTEGTDIYFFSAPMNQRTLGRLSEPSGYKGLWRFNIFHNWKKISFKNLEYEKENGLINTIWAALYHVHKKGACYLEQETSTTRLAL